MMLPVKPREAWNFVRADRSNPYVEWFESLSDIKTQVRIDRRIARLEDGNWGDYRLLGGGLVEARIDYGPGWRIYFGVAEPALVVLLLGGTKRTQDRDIEKARALWREYETTRKKRKWYLVA